MAHVMDTDRVIPLDARTWQNIEIGFDLLATNDA